MKYFILVIVALFTMQLSFGQTIDAAQVPANVKSSFESDFSGVNLIRWEKYNGFIKYVAVFDNSEKVRCRARYKEDGKGISATTYFWFPNVKKVPQGIKNYASSKYPDYKLVGAEKEMSLKDKSKYGYRVKLRKGGKKVTVWLDENGKEIDKNSLSKDLITEEKIGQ